MASTAQRESLITSTTERAQAATLLSEAQGAAVSLTVTTAGGKAVPKELSRLLTRVLAAVASGRTVSLSTLPRELTTTATASLLGVSRPTVMKLISEGRLQAHKVGSHTRLWASDVLGFSRSRLDKQRQAFGALRELEEDLPLP